MNRAGNIYDLQGYHVGNNYPDAEVQQNATDVEEILDLYEEQPRGLSYARDSMESL